MDSNLGADTVNTSPEFKVERLYTRNISLETANSPANVTLTSHPEIKLELNVSTQPHSISDQHEVVLSVTVTAKADSNLIYLGKVQQAGIFTVKEFAEDQKQSILNSICASLLYPYAGERLSNLITYSGFPPLHLVPINFDQLHAQRKQAEMDTTETSASSIM